MSGAAEPLLGNVEAGGDRSTSPGEAPRPSLGLVDIRRGKRRVKLLIDKIKGMLPHGSSQHVPMTTFGSFLFLSNLSLGPAILGMPAAFRCSGVVPTAFLTILFAAASTLAGAFVAHAVRIYKEQKIRTTLPPGAQEHTLEHAPHLELENLVRGATATWGWCIFQVCFLASMIVMAITCIVITAQGCDTLSIMLFGNSWGLQLTPHFGFVASCPTNWGCEGSQAFATVANQNGLLLSFGYMVTLALSVPFSLIDVSEGFQFASYGVSLLCLMWLIVKFIIIAVEENHSVKHGGALPDGGPGSHSQLPPAWTMDLELALEVNFWSWVVSFAVPMWLDEKNPDDPLAPPLAAAFAHRAALDIVFGVAGAAAFPRLPPSALNVLQAVAVHPACGSATRFAGVLFVVSNLVSNIVDYAMVAVRNLECHVGFGVATCLGLVLPFVGGFTFYFGATFADLVTVASPFLNGAVQFVVPAALFCAYAGMEPASSALPVLGIRTTSTNWRIAAAVMALAASALIATTYALSYAAPGGAPPASSDEDYGVAALGQGR